MQKESNRYKWIDFDQKVRTYGQDAGIVFQERNGDKDWEWYSEEEAARLTYDGKEKLKFDPRGDGSLTINGNVKVDGTKIEINHGTTVPTKNADTEAPGLRLDSPNDGGLIYGYDTNNSIFLRVGLDGDAAVIDSHAYGRLRFFTGGQLNEQKERLRIDETGYVGIGTMEPKSKLDVAGDVWVAGIVNTGWLTVREPLTAMKGVNIDGGLTINTGGANISPGLGVNGPLGVTGVARISGDLIVGAVDFGHAVRMYSFLDENSNIWFKVDFLGNTIATLNLNNGRWQYLENGEWKQ
jgi:hypothetical protein